MEKTSRYDEFYLSEDHFSEPKEYFKKAVEILVGERISRGARLLDIGCASGDFLRYTHIKLPEVSLSGMDVFQPLLDEAQKRLPDAEFFSGDMNADELDYSGDPFQAVTMLGVLSIFSSENWISNFASLVGRGGYGLIFGMVNPYPYDVFVNLRNADGEYEHGWNSWSARTLQDRFEDLGFSVEVEHWTPPVSIDRKPDEPLRSWTEDLANGERLIVNGSRMVHDFAFVKLRR